MQISNKIVNNLEAILGVDIPSFDIENVSKEEMAELLHSIPSVYGVKSHSFIANIIREFFSEHILGLYLDHLGKCYMCESNIEAAALNTGMEFEDLQQIVVIHEHIHLVQHQVLSPWLTEHIQSQIKSFADSLSFVSGDKPDIVKSISVFKESWDNTMNVMTIVEGHAEYVTTVVTQMKRKKSEKNSLLKVLLKWKLEQYTKGYEWCEKVHLDYGWDTLNKVWLDAKYMPTKEEIENHHLWAMRISELQSFSALG